MLARNRIEEAIPKCNNKNRHQPGSWGLNIATRIEITKRYASVAMSVGSRELRLDDTGGNMANENKAGNIGGLNAAKKAAPRGRGGCGEVIPKTGSREQARKT